MLRDTLGANLLGNLGRKRVQLKQAKEPLEQVKMFNPVPSFN